MIKLTVEHNQFREERLVVLFKRLLRSQVETEKLIRSIATSQQTYHVGATTDGEAFIACFACGSVSFNPTDIEKKYCGMCRDFHEG